MDAALPLRTYLESIKRRLAINADSSVVVDISELSIRFPSSGDNPLSEDDVYYLQTALAELDLGSEPDISKHYRKLDLSGKLALYIAKETHQLPASVIVRERIFFSALSLVAKADGVLVPDEIEYIAFCRKYRSAQSGIPLSRISAISELALTERRHDLAARLSNLAKHFPSKQQLLEFFANIIISDGHIDKRELYAYCELFELIEGHRPTIGEAKSALERHAKSLHKQLRRERAEMIEETTPEYFGNFEEDILNQIFSDF